MTLRVGVDVREWRRGTSTGIGRFITGFVAWAAQSSEHQLLLIGNQDTAPRFQADGPDADHGVQFYIEQEGKRLLWDQHVLPRWLRTQRIDVFLSPYYKVPVRAPCPTVATVHDLIPLHYPRSGEDGVRGALLYRWMRLMLNRATRVVTDSEFSKRDIVATLGADSTKIEVVPLRVEPAFAQRPPDAKIDSALEVLGLERGYVAYVGRYDPHKTVDSLAAAWKSLDNEVRARHPLVLVGRGGETIAAGHEGINALGFVSDDLLASVYAGAAVFAFPSRYEGFGLPPLEAMGCGTPVLCSNAASLPEVVADAARMLPPDQPEAWTAALRHILTDAAERDRLIAAGTERVARYSTEATVPALMKLLEEVAR